MCRLCLALVFVVSTWGGWGQTLVLEEGFEGVFPGAWVAEDTDLGSGFAYWGAVPAGFGGEGTVAGDFKGYCAGVGHSGTAELPLYQGSMLAHLRRTFNLAGYSRALLRFYHKIPSVETDFDGCRIVLTQGGLAETVWSRDTPVTPWTRVVLNLADRVGDDVQVDFQFYSDVSVSREGWYLDNIAVLAGNGPPNDFFDAPLRLVGASGSYNGSSIGAAKEPGEPDHTGNSGGASVWFSWTAPTSNPVKFSTLDNTFDSTMAVYVGDRVDNLQLIVENDDADPGQILTSTVQFIPVANQTYWIAVDGYDGDEGEIRMIWEAFQDPPQVLSVSSRGNPNGVTVTWSEPVSAGSGLATGNYQIQGAIVFSAAFGASPNIVELTTSPLTVDTQYFITINNVRDLQQNLVFPSPTVLSFVHGAEFPSFQVLEKHYDVGPGVLLPALTNNPVFPNAPDQVTPREAFEIPVNVADNYGATLSGIYVAPQTGNYRFYLCSDGQGIAFLGRQANPLRKQILAFEPIGSSSRDYGGLTNRSQANPENRSNLVSLVAGEQVYLEAQVKAGLGGGNLSLAVQLPGQATAPTQPIAAAAFRPMRHYQGQTFATFGPVQVLQPPLNRSVPEGGVAVFDAWVDGTPPYRLQWRRNGAPLTGATNQTLHYGPVTLADGGARFDLVVQNEFSSTTTAPALLTVQEVPRIPFTLGIERWGVNGIRLLGPPPDLATNAFYIQASSNLLDWANVYTNRPPNAFESWIDPEASSNSRRHYRAKDYLPGLP